ncbi:MAG: hypothetical protein AVDCRST_MAG30-4588, partial [uncultured Solirubrobacteraceae bacterium]
AAQRPHGHRRPLHRAPAGHPADQVPRDAGARQAADAGRQRDGEPRAPGRDRPLPHPVGTAADRLAVGRLAGRLPDGLRDARHRHGVLRPDRLPLRHARDHRAHGRPVAHPAPRRRPRPDGGRARADLHGDRRDHRLGVRLLVLRDRGSRAHRRADAV